ncbi:MAG: hypothetical protein H6667_14465 [Ardenticatenaceae bacterium]|nr:hypothetical protein [Ardenticatenaceae bacterium]MCB9445558.1 hypothetical protein [Ardenticatenaceae bacterium]
MTEYIEETTERHQISPLAVTGGALVVLLVLVLLLTRGGGRPLKPIRPSATPVELNQSSQAILVTFDELNANPYAYRDQRIRITGSYTPQPKPDCPNYKGLLIRWALINENLQLNGYGFEEVLKLVPEGTSLTVEGIWRLYDGISGCGKGAPQTLIWYLQVERIVQPNPLPGYGPLPDGDTPAPVGTPPLEEAEPTPTAENGTAVFTPTSSPTITATPTTEITPSVTSSPTATLLFGEMTPTPSDSFITSTPDPSASPTATGTGPTPTNTPPPLTTPGTAVPTVPGLSPSTPGPSPTPGSGYPAPGTPTPTLDPYP